MEAGRRRLDRSVPTEDPCPRPTEDTSPPVLSLRRHFTGLDPDQERSRPRTGTFCTRTGTLQQYLSEVGSMEVHPTLTSTWD